VESSGNSSVSLAANTVNLRCNDDDPNVSASSVSLAANTVNLRCNDDDPNVRASSVSLNSNRVNLKRNDEVRKPFTVMSISDNVQSVLPILMTVPPIDRGVRTVPARLSEAEFAFTTLADTGAEFSSMSSKCFEILRNVSTCLPVVDFNPGIRLKGLGGKIQRIERAITVSINVIYDTPWLFEEEIRPRPSGIIREKFAVVDSGYDVILSNQALVELKADKRIGMAMKYFERHGRVPTKGGEQQRMAMSVAALGRTWKLSEALDDVPDDRPASSCHNCGLSPLGDESPIDYEDETSSSGSEQDIGTSSSTWDTGDDDWGWGSEPIKKLATSRGFKTFGGRYSPKPCLNQKFSPNKSGSSNKRKLTSRDIAYRTYPHHPFADCSMRVEPVEDEYVCDLSSLNMEIENGLTRSSTELLGTAPEEEDEFKDIDPFLNVDYSDNEPPSLKPGFSAKVIDAFGEVWQRRARVFGKKLHPNGANVNPLKLEVKPGAATVAMSPRRFSVPLLDIIGIEVSKLENGDVIAKSLSNYSAEIVMVRQNGKFRMCIDYSALNETLVGMQHPIPNIRELLDKLAGKKFLGKLDLRSGYHQFPIDADSQHLTAFRAGNNLYQFKRIPFGLKMAPAYFQHIMQDILGSLIGRTCFVYLDDIIVFGDTEEEFVENLDTILGLLDERDIILRGEKCVMATSESSLEILGYELNDCGITLSAEKKQGLQDMQQPTSKACLRSFNGLANYFRPFIKDFATIMKPLTEATGKLKFQWTPTMNEAFMTMKSEVHALGMLFYLEESEPLFLRTDASNKGVGGILFQRTTNSDTVEERPVAYVSKAFNTTEANWSTIEQEGFAIFHCVMKLQHYLKGRHFVIETDHRNLVYMTKSLTPKVIRWRLRLLEFDFDVFHIAGEDNVVADALSRCLSIRILSRALGGYAANLGKVAPKYVIAANALKAIESVHNHVIGHFGSKATIQLLDEIGSDWKSRSEDVAEYIRACGKCQKTARGTGTVEDVYRSTMADVPFAKVAIDTIGPLPPDQAGNEYIMVAIDCFTRVVEMKATKSTSAVEAASFLLEIFGRYGPPTVIHSDGGPQYAAQVVKEFIRLFAMKKSVTLPYRPQANGINERVNGEVMRHLTALTMDDPLIKANWSLSLPIVARIVNYSYHSAIGTYPAKLLYGRNTNGTGILLDGIELPKPQRHQVPGFDYLEKLMRIQKDVIRAAQKFQQAIIQKRVSKIPKGNHVLFRAGDFVLASYPSNKPDKLAPRWRGPLLVVEKVKTNTFRVQHLNDTSRTELLHITRLKPYNASYSDPSDVATMDDASDKIDFIVEHSPPGPFPKKKSSLDFRVRWVGYDEEADLWLPYSEMANTEALDKYMTKFNLFFK
jgi:hypothetical protein